MGDAPKRMFVRGKPNRAMGCWHDATSLSETAAMTSDGSNPMFSYILSTPEALAASPEVQKLVAEAEARGMERALETMKTTGDSAVTEAMGQRLCCNGQDCGCHGATVEQYLEHLIRAEAAIRRAAEETGT